MNLRIGLAACSLVAFTPMAMAQTMKPPGDGASSGQQAPSSIQNGRSESLSGKLDRSGGVITPKGDVDPAIQAPAPVPRPNSTPVIPPSATGGQNAK